MYVVTGGAGFIGSALVSKLNEEGIQDVIIVDNLTDSSKWKNLLGKSFIDYFHRDKFLELLEQGRFKGKVTSVIHMGACSATTEEDMDFLMENNYRYSKRLAEHCLENGMRFIYASSAATYGDGTLGYSDTDQEQAKFRPLNRYGYSKQLFDLWLIRSQYTSEAAGLKFFNVYGPNEYHKGEMRSVVNKAYHQIKQTGAVQLFKSYRPDYADGEQMRDFIYVRDCVDVIWWLLDNPEVNGIFNLGTGTARTWKSLAEAVFDALDLEPSIEFVEMPQQLRRQYQYFTEADIGKLRAAGYDKPFRSLEDGVRDYVQNFLESKEPYL